MSEHIVIIGAGQAAAQAITTLNAEGFSGKITLVGDEAYAPYQRPPLSKAYLMGTFQRERLFLKPEAFYAQVGCTMELGVSATAIDRAKKTVALSDGRSLSYDKLMLATGTRGRKLNIPGSDLNGIHYLRSIADVDKLREDFKPGERLAIIGGGYIGLEVAAVAAKRGLSVTVFEVMERLMQRAVSPVVSEFYANEHRKAGVELLLQTGVEAFEGKGRIEGLRAKGKFHAADFALVGVGALPNCELAEAAGLECRDGVVVDQSARTSDPAIFAAGDCTRHIGREGVELRLESVQNAIDQAKHAALAMLGKPALYSEVPWFWSDQFDLKMQIAGLSRPTDQIVVRGDPAKRTFAVFHLRDGAVAAVEAINAVPEYMMGRKLIAANARISAETLADTAIPMKKIAETG